MSHRLLLIRRHSSAFSFEPTYKYAFRGVQLEGAGTNLSESARRRTASHADQRLWASLRDLHR